MTITITGGQDIFRFALNMLDDQVEFCEAGSEILTSLRGSLGPARFDPMARSMLGAEKFEKLAGWGYFGPVDTFDRPGAPVEGGAS